METVLTLSVVIYVNVILDIVRMQRRVKVLHFFQLIIFAFNPFNKQYLYIVDSRLFEPRWVNKSGSNNQNSNK